MSNEDRKQFPKGGGPASAPSGRKPAEAEKKPQPKKEGAPRAPFKVR